MLMLGRRTLLRSCCAGALGLSASSLVACLGRRRVSAERIAELCAAGEHAAVESLMPEGARVVISGLVFHDWAYPSPERVEATQADPQRWAEVTSRSDETGHSHHGIKLRLPGEHDDEVLHRSGPKLIAFLPSTEGRAVSLLKRAYAERFELSVTVSWIGVLTSEVWTDVEVIEDDMVGLFLHGVR